MIEGKILVHLRAPVLSASGYGGHSREIIDYLLDDDRFIVALESISWGNCGFLNPEKTLNPEKFEKYYQSIAIWEQIKDKEQFDLAIHVSIPNEFERTAKVNIGVTAGIETDRVSREWVHKCNEMDLIVVPSHHSATVLQGTVYEVMNNQTGESKEERVIKPIYIIGEYFNKPEEIKPLDIKFETKKNLLFVGLWGGKGGFGEDRKNVADLIKLFISEFKDNPKVGLILKTQLVNGSVKDKLETEKRIKKIKENFGGDKVKCKIYLIHQDLSDTEMWGLYNHPQVTGMISLTHGEGFGRPLLEAISCGKPVLATNWSGHLDFLQKKKGFIPLKFEMVKVPECQHWEGVITKDSRWAKVDDKDVIKRMKKFLDSPTAIRKQAEKHIEWLEENFSKKSINKAWDNFFELFIKSEEEKEEEVVAPEYRNYNSQKKSAIEKLKENVDLESDKKKVIYIIPQSAGDCLISTAIINSLIMNRHWDTDYDFYVATSEQYKPLFNKLVDKYGVKVIDYNPGLMMDTEILRGVWDYVYSPGINIQFRFSNWLLGNGEFSVRLLEEFAKNCNLHPGEITNYQFNMEECELPEKAYVVIHPGGQKSSKRYRYWNDIVINLKSFLDDIEIIQIGTTDEELIEGALDYRGKTFDQSFYILDNAFMFLGVDSFPAHAAAAVGTPHLVLYASTHANACAPVILKRKKVPHLAIEENSRCNPKCYKDFCMKAVDGKNCLSYIEPKSVCNAAFLLAQKIKEQEEEEKDDDKK